MTVRADCDRIRCPRCRVGGYTQGASRTGRPEFTCTRCDYVWTSGLDGGVYALPAKGQERAS